MRESLHDFRKLTEDPGSSPLPDLPLTTDHLPLTLMADPPLYDRRQMDTIFIDHKDQKFWSCHAPPAKSCGCLRGSALKPNPLPLTPNFDPPLYFHRMVLKNSSVRRKNLNPSPKHPRSSKSVSRILSHPVHQVSQREAPVRGNKLLADLGGQNVPAPSPSAVQSEIGNHTAEMASCPVQPVHERSTYFYRGEGHPNIIRAIRGSPTLRFLRFLLFAPDLGSIFTTPHVASSSRMR